MDGSSSLQESDFQYSLPMLSDRKTEMYVKSAKVMIYFQGPVNAKRRNLISSIGITFKYASKIISDDTYKEETVNAFDPETTEEFYRYFKDRVKKACEDGYNLIVIDQSMCNTNQMKYYFFLAQTFQYVIFPLPPVVTEKGHVRGIRTQASSYEQFDRPLECPNFFKHLFCGWYLHDVDTAALREEAILYAQDCFDIPEFNEMMSKSCKRHMLKDQYNMENIRKDLACCLVKIFLNSVDAGDYMSRDIFMRFYGKMSKLYIVGFIISPHIIAARVRLTYDQKHLWELPDDLDPKVKPNIFPSQLKESTNVGMPHEDVSRPSSKSNRTVITGQTNHKPTDAIPCNARGRSCHIVLGKVKDAPIENVDYDVPFAVFRERMALPKYSENLKPYDLSRSLVRRIGKYLFIYLKESIVVDGFFATCCSVESSIA